MSGVNPVRGESVICGVTCRITFDALARAQAELGLGGLPDMLTRATAMDPLTMRALAIAATGLTAAEVDALPPIGVIMEVAAALNNAMGVTSIENPPPPPGETAAEG